MTSSQTVALSVLLVACSSAASEGAVEGFLTEHRHAAEEVCACSSALGLDPYECLNDFDVPSYESSNARIQKTLACQEQALALVPETEDAYRCRAKSADALRSCVAKADCRAFDVQRCLDRHVVDNDRCPPIPERFTTEVALCEYSGQDLLRVRGELLRALCLDLGEEWPGECDEWRDIYRECARPIADANERALIAHTECVVRSAQRHCGSEIDATCAEAAEDAADGCPIPASLEEELEACIP